MSGGFANIVVGLAVLGALLYSIWRLGPPGVRRWALSKLSRAFPALAGWSVKSGCEACGSCAPPPNKAAPLKFVPPSKLHR